MTTPTIYCACGRNDDGSLVALSTYAGESPYVVNEKVAAVARREGFQGLSIERLKELGWEIHPFVLQEHVADTGYPGAAFWAADDWWNAEIALLRTLPSKAPRTIYKQPVPPPGADILDVVMVEGWNQCCDAFFGGHPPQEPVVITITDADLLALLPGTYYMDPPDGGDVSVLEQLRRMSEDARKWRELQQLLRDMPKSGA